MQVLKEVAGGWGRRVMGVAAGPLLFTGKRDRNLGREREDMGLLYTLWEEGCSDLGI